MSLTVLNMSQANLFGYAAAALVFVTFWMKTMVPLRVLGIGSNIFFIVYGYLASAYPPLFLAPAQYRTVARDEKFDQAG